MSIAAMKQALDALESCTEGDFSTGHVIHPWFDERAVDGAITALRTAIEEAERAEQAKQIAEGFRPLAESCKRTKFRRDIKTAVDRFLCWKLPEHFGPDCYVSFDREKAAASRSWPIGTNLLTAEQAKEMFEHCLEGTGYVAYPQEAERAEPVGSVNINPECNPDVSDIYLWAKDLPLGVHYLYTHPAPVPEDKVLVPRDVILFLNGSAPLDGLWFGEKRPAGAFWWRKYLPAAEKEPT